MDFETSSRYSSAPREPTSPLQATLSREEHERPFSITPRDDGISPVSTPSPHESSARHKSSSPRAAASLHQALESPSPNFLRDDEIQPAVASSLREPSAPHAVASSSKAPELSFPQSLQDDEIRPVGDYFPLKFVLRELSAQRKWCTPGPATDAMDAAERPFLAFLREFEEAERDVRLMADEFTDSVRVATFTLDCARLRQPRGGAAHAKDITDASAKLGTDISPLREAWLARLTYLSLEGARLRKRSRIKVRAQLSDEFDTTIARVEELVAEMHSHDEAHQNISARFRKASDIQ